MTTDGREALERHLKGVTSDLQRAHKLNHELQANLDDWRIRYAERCREVADLRAKLEECEKERDAARSDADDAYAAASKRYAEDNRMLQHALEECERERDAHQQQARELHDLIKNSVGAYLAQQKIDALRAALEKARERQRSISRHIDPEILKQYIRINQPFTLEGFDGQLVAMQQKLEIMGREIDAALNIASDAESNSVLVGGHHANSPGKAGALTGEGGSPGAERVDGAPSQTPVNQQAVRKPEPPSPAQPFWIILHGGGPTMEFVEIETEDGRSCRRGVWDKHGPDEWRLGPFFEMQSAADPCRSKRADKPGEGADTEAKGTAFAPCQRAHVGGDSGKNGGFPARRFVSCGTTSARKSNKSNKSSKRSALKKRLTVGITSQTMEALMPFFLQILEGQTANEARPLFATSDSKVIVQVAKALMARLGAKTPPASIVRLAHGIPPGGQHAGCRVNERRYRKRIAELERERDQLRADYDAAVKQGDVLIVQRDEALAGAARRAEE